ncbi:MAG: non-heme iron oxygenase ferredoxin subunit [Gammaproteobacteria bacterium]|nr:non-heme iron oxygenase ferredoxin subunit [Gammaproteobacteria bacterium]
MPLIKLCAIAELDRGFPVRVEADGFPPLAVYAYAATYYVTDDTCTHGQASLCDGYQEGDVIECPFHGGQFDIKTGAALAYPCTEAIRSYPAVINDGWVCIAAENQA